MQGKMKPVLKLSVVALLLSLAQLSYAECEGLPERLNQELGYPDHEKEVYFSACKVWPADANKTIVALAHFQKGSSFSVPPDSSVGLYDLDVLIVKTGGSEIQHHLFQKGAFNSDAIYLNGIEIDTARYQLAPGVIAFGLRINRGGRAEVQTIKLYVMQQNKMKQILSKLSMVEYFAEAQVDCPHSSDVRRTLAIASTASHGYADLILNEKRIESGPVMNKTDCGVKMQSSHRYTLRFDGSTYVVPQELRSDY